MLLLSLQTGCVVCPEGRVTAYVPGDGSFHNSIHDCKVPPGYGVFSADAADTFAPAVRSASLKVEKCPVGYFSTGDTAQGERTRNPACLKNPANTYTTLPGQTACDGQCSQLTLRLICSGDGKHALALLCLLFEQQGLLHCCFVLHGLLHRILSSRCYMLILTQHTYMPAPLLYIGIPFPAVCAAVYGIPSSKPNSQNSNDCEPCEAGTFSTGNSLRCSACPPTTFNYPKAPTFQTA
jgi:hypothetical protein